MTITRGDWKYSIWTRLLRSQANPGIYSEALVNDVIQEVYDDIAAEQIFGNEGFRHKLDYLSPVSGTVAMAIPGDVAVIGALRYLNANIYYPLGYDQEWDDLQWANGSGVVQDYPLKYRMVDNNFYFNPAIGVGGTNYLQIEYLSYPRRLTKDSDSVPMEFERAMGWYLVNRACSKLVGSVGQTVMNFQDDAAEWRDRMVRMIYMRTQQSIPIREFTG